MTKVLRIINRFNIGGPTYNATFLTRFISDDFETLLIGGLPEEGEDIRVHTLAANDVFAELLSGAFNNAAAIICLQWLQINRQRLREQKITRGD